MSIWYLVFGLAVAFFLIVPGAGAVGARRRWRLFRHAVTAAARRPTVSYAAGEGRYRFFGRLEAIADDDVIWLNDGTISVAADVADTVCYLLPPPEVPGARSRGYPEATPDRVPWSRLTSLPERTQVFVSGPLRVVDGRPVFRAEGAENLLVILYEGPDEELLERAVWTGRQRNEYWNLLTPASLAVGALALLLTAYVVLRLPAGRAPAIMAVSLALVPVLPLLPPGFLTFPFYRRLWRRGRFLRAERDLLRLPLAVSFDADGRAELPDGESYAMCRVSAEEVGRLEQAGAVFLDVAVAPERPDYHAFGRPADGMPGDGDPEKGEPEDGMAGEVAAPLARPDDPMAPFVVVPGDPATLATRSQARAQMYEVSAITGLLAGVGVNFYLALLLVSRAIF